MIGTIRDITKLKEAEQKLKESEEKYRTVFENTGTATVIIEEDTIISLANEKFEQLSGFSKEEIEGKKSWKEFVIKEDLDRMINHHYSRREDLYEAPKSYEFRFVNKEGEIRDILLKIDIIPKSKKSVASLLNITDRKQNEQLIKESERQLRDQNIKLKKLDKIKNNFITIIAHELKTPIISIRGYPEFILAKYDDLEPEIEKDLKRVINNTQRLEDHINQLLEIMKIDSEKIEITLKKTNLYDLIQECISNLNLLIKKKKINLIIDVNKNLYLNIDSFRISQVFSNLIFNAIKFTQKLGDIIITAEKLPSKYEFKIKDSGQGLNEEEIKILIDKITNLDQYPENISAFKKSAGLGLYIAKNIIKAHGGDIKITSEGPGKGAEICFFLPITN